MLVNIPYMEHMGMAIFIFFKISYISLIARGYGKESRVYGIPCMDFGEADDKAAHFGAMFRQA